MFYKTITNNFPITMIKVKIRHFPVIEQNRSSFLQIRVNASARVLHFCLCLFYKLCSLKSPAAHAPACGPALVGNCLEIRTVLVSPSWLASSDLSVLLRAYKNGKCRASPKESMSSGQACMAPVDLLTFPAQVPALDKCDRSCVITDVLTRPWAFISHPSLNTFHLLSMFLGTLLISESQVITITSFLLLFIQNTRVSSPFMNHNDLCICFLISYTIYIQGETKFHLQIFRCMSFVSQYTCNMLRDDDWVCFLREPGTKHRKYIWKVYSDYGKTQYSANVTETCLASPKHRLSSLSGQGKIKGIDKEDVPIYQ